MGMRRRIEYGDKNTIGQRLCALRKQRGMKQKELLAQLQLRGIDISASSLSELEGQRRKVTDHEVIMLASIFEVSSDELLKIPIEK